MPKGFPIGFEMAEKNGNKQTDKQTDKHFRIYISRDDVTSLFPGYTMFKSTHLATTWTDKVSPLTWGGKEKTW